MSFFNEFSQYFTARSKKPFAKHINNKKKANSITVINAENVAASSWWGKAWNRNIEKYSDWENRLERGLIYFLDGAVTDLDIKPGQISALVQGSDFAPYEVEVFIRPISAPVWKKTIARYGKKIHSLYELKEGRFPAALSEYLLKMDGGLFPDDDEIDFECSCPDEAYMCKHVAAVLYCIGTLFDRDPALFFKLRKVNVEGLVTKFGAKKPDNFLQNITKKNGYIISNDHLLMFYDFLDLIESEKDTAKLKKMAAIFAALAEYASKKIALLKAVDGI